MASPLSPVPLSSSGGSGEDESSLLTDGEGDHGSREGIPARKKKRLFFCDEWLESHPWVRYVRCMCYQTIDLPVPIMRHCPNHPPPPPPHPLPPTPQVYLSCQLFFLSVIDMMNQQGRYSASIAQTKQRSAMAFPGSNRLKRCVLQEHEKTHAHKHALTAVKQKNRTAEAILQELQRNDKALVNLFRVMLCLAREDLAILKFDVLCSLVGKCGAQILNSYRNNHSGSEILQTLATTLTADLIACVRQSPFLSILVDESTDVSVHKQMILYLRYLGQTGPVTQFGSILQLQDGTASTISAAIRHQLTEWGVHIAHIVGLGSDGASVMTGTSNGVGARLIRDVPLPHLVQIHCVAHRLALASTDATDKLPDIIQYEKVIKDLYNYLAHSTVRREELQFYQNLCDDPAITIKGFSAVRWLSVHNSVQSVSRSYTSLLAFFSMEAIDSSAARGIYAELRKWRFAALTFILNDILGSLTTLSKKFQRDDLPLPRLLGLVETTKRELTACYLNEDGPIWGLTYREWLAKDGDAGATELVREEDDEAFLQRTSCSFVRHVIEALVERFPSSSFINAVQVIDPARIPKDDAAKVRYGEDSIKVLCQQFPAFLDEETVLSEWNQLKFEDTAAPVSFNESPWKFYQVYQVSYPNFWKLVQALLVLPVNTAACERGFSKLKIVKTDRRNRLSSQQLNNLMTVSLAQLGNEDSVIGRAIKLWHRQKRRHFSPNSSKN